MSCVTFGAAISRAQEQQDQSIAEAARQERARKQELQKRAKHVYTEEDLKHPNILTPEDRAQIEAKRNECAQKNNCSPAPSQNPPERLDANSQAPQIPLGDIARQLREQKELQALKPKQTEPFHLPLSTPALASPILPERPAIRSPTQPTLRPKIPSNVFRRDPFFAVPVRPEVRRREIRPGVRENVRPDVHADVRGSGDENIRPTVRSKVSSDVHPKVREDVLPFVHPNVPPTAIATQKTVSVQRGDSLWKLAQQNLGRGNRWRELLAVNPRIADPNQIRVGAQLNLPGAVAAPTSARNTSNNTASTIRVRKGATLWTLARSNLGRSSAWHCLATANPSISNPNRIYENQELVVPQRCKP